MTFRFAAEEDAGLILHFIRQLAEYEKMSDQVTATEELLRERAGEVPLLAALTGSGARPLAEELGRIVWQQGPRSLITGDGRVFVLCSEGLGEFDPADGSVKVVCRFPIKAATGGAFTGGRLYFAAASHLYSVRP